MKEQDVKKRGWVKNAAIVFLAAMLALTFFSNTIMNRSLPEVAARYTTSGSINARIRGSGTVSANDRYEVIINQTRTVRDVNVRLDREVEVGDVLFTLTDNGSAELDAAIETLQALLLDYERAVINARLNGDYASDERQIRIARERLEEAENELGEITNDESGIDEARDALSKAEEELAAAEEIVASASSRVSLAETSRDYARVTESVRRDARDEAQRNLNALGGLQTANTAELDRQISEISAQITNKDAEIRVALLVYGDDYDDFVSAAEAHFTTVVIPEPTAEDPTPSPISVPPEAWANAARRAAYLAAFAELFGVGDPLHIAYRTITDLRSELAELEAKRTQLRGQRNAEQGTDNSQQHSLLSRRLTEAEAALTTASQLLDSAEASLAAAREDHSEAVSKRNDARSDLSAAESGLRLAQESRASDLKQANDAIKSRQEDLENMLFSLSEKQKTDGVAGALHALNMEEKRTQIDNKREEIARLENDDTDVVITSPVRGIVKQINISPGNQTQPGSPLAVIEVLDRGYTLSFPVTLDQSRKVSLGDIADVDWWYWGEIMVILSSIRNDPQNPATSRILEFDVSGDVQSGTQLSLSLGERSANYDVIVPNSALRSDTNGDFVLVVLSRSSPLGNRYVATRVDVNILASDDTNSAVTGGLSGWDFVITTSNKPIEPGMQVRFVDNP